MRYSSRFFLYAPIALFLCFAALVMFHWWRVAGALDQRLKALKGHEAVPGVTLDWSSVTLSGFPFRLDVTFEGFAVKGEGAHGPFAWTAEHFAAHALTYGAQKDVFEAAGNQTLAWTDAAGAAHQYSFLPGSIRASAVRDAQGLARFDTVIVALDGKDIRIAQAQFHMRRNPNRKSIDLMAQADAVKGPPGPFGGARTLQLYQSLAPASALLPLLKGDASPAAAAAAFQAAGGRAAITQSTLNGRKNALSPEESAAAIRLLDPLY